MTTPDGSRKKHIRSLPRGGPLMRLAGVGVVAVAVGLTALALSRPSANPPVGAVNPTISPRSSTAVGLSPATSANPAPAASKAATTLPDPCSLLTTADTRAFIDRWGNGTVDVRDFSGPAVKSQACEWTFAQYWLADGQLASVQGAFFRVLVRPASDYPAGPCKALGGSPGLTPLTGVGDCAFGSGAGPIVVVGALVANTGFQGATGFEANSATDDGLRLALEKDIATRLAGALAR